ncbi:L-fuconate dehydratase [Lachnospiraceae bacterium KM106-2]|nr:L-fuconate dehydratase [Lachnospiraceae bacterium KM106-2]
MKAKKRHLHKIITITMSFLLTLSTVLSVFPTSAEAYTPFKTMDQFQIDGKGPTYYNVGYTGDMEDQQNFLKTGLKARDLNRIWEGAGMVAFYDKVNQFTLDPKEGTEAYMRMFVGRDRNITDQNKVNIKSKWNDSDLRYAKDGSTAFNEIQEYIVSLYRGVSGAQKREKKEDIVVKDLSEFSSGTTTSIWQTFGYVINSSDDGKDWEGHYIQLAVLYDNFRLTPVLPADYGKGTATATSIPGQSKQISGGYTNSTKKEVEASQNIGSETVETVTNTVEGSKTFTFSQNFSYSSEVTVSGLLASGSLSQTFGIGAEQAFSSGWSDSVENSKTTRSESAVSINMPPHTQVSLQQTNGKNIVTNNYDCPVALSYDVKIAAFVLDPKVASAKPEAKVLATFDNSSGALDAQDDYVQRRVKKFYDKDKIDWDTSYWALYNYWYDVEQKHDPIGKEFIELYNNLDGNFKNQIPVSITGGTMKYQIDGYTTKVEDIIPLHPITSISTADGIKEYQMVEGDRKVLDHIPLEGYNTHGVVYYGFNQQKGHWKLINSDGTDADDSVCNLDIDPMNGQVTAIAKSPGTVYAKYVIDENCYNSADNIKDYATDKEVNTVKIKLQVSDKEFDGTVENSGSVSYCIKDDPVNLDTAEGLNATVCDSTGIEINAPVVWQAKELNGISVKNNELTASKEGSYHIRATYHGKYASSWIEVTVKAARKLVKLELQDNCDPKVMADQNSSGANQIDLSSLTCKGYDQYGKEITSLNNLKFECKQKENVSLNKDQNGAIKATISAPGTYEFYVSLDGVVSNTLSVKIIKTWLVKFNSTDSKAGTIQVIADDKELVSGEAVVDGTAVKMIAHENDGYELKAILVNGSPVKNESTITIDQDTQIEAEFQVKVEPATPEPATPEPATPEPATPEPATPEPATPEPATPEPATPEPVTPTPDPAKPAPVTQQPTTQTPVTSQPKSYSVSYKKNTSKTVVGLPTDTKKYKLGNKVQVKGGLVSTSAFFTGWNTKPNGTGKSYVPGGKFAITNNVTLYAQWKTNYTKSSLKYKVVGNKVVSCTGTTNKSMKKIKIANNITYKGITYKVTSVGKNAFKGNSKVISVSIPNKVKTLNDFAFYGMKNLSKVTIGNGLTKIGKHVFCHAKKNCVIVISSSKLKTVGSPQNHYAVPMIIKVPKNKVKAYKKLFMKNTKGIVVKKK